ncbi:MAG: hypothetical protein IKA05_08560 [Clostridia bacterium]|nr:hypothetical protein [Clostridia bacterium]
MFDREDYIHFLQKVKAHRAYPHVMAVLRAIGTYAAYALMCRLTVDSIHSNFHSIAEGYIPYEAVIREILGILLLILMLNSVLLTFALYHRLDREMFLQRATLEEYDARKEKGIILHDWPFWVELGSLWVFFLVFPPIYGYSHIWNLIPTLKAALSPILQRLLLTVLFAIASFLLSFHSRLDARNYWLELPGRLMSHRVWMSMSKKKQRKYSFGSFLLRLLGYMLIYVWVIPMAAVTLAVLINLLGIARLLLVTPLFFVPLLAVIVWFYLRALRYRGKFIRKLKRICLENGFELFDCRRPYRSIFRDTNGYCFGVTAHGKTYYCRLLASVKRGNQMILDENGTCTRVAGLLRTFQARMTSVGGYVQAEMPAKDGEREILSYTTSIDYRFEADGEKLLILNPVPKKVLRKVQNTTREVDNGDRIGEYLVYTGNAFIRSLQADCIGKLDRKDPYKWI